MQENEMPHAVVSFERFISLNDFAASFLAAEGSTRRMIRNNRPSFPARPARWIQTDKAFGVTNRTTSSPLACEPSVDFDLSSWHPVEALGTSRRRLSATELSGHGFINP